MTVRFITYPPLYAFVPYFSQTMRIFADVATLPYFDSVARELYDALFNETGIGVLAGLLQGQPHEPHSNLYEHPESGMIVSAATLEHCYHGQAESPRKRMKMFTESLSYTVTDRSAQGYFNGLQVAAGLFFLEMWIPMRAWSNHYRVPYWAHR